MKRCCSALKSQLQKQGFSSRVKLRYHNLIYRLWKRSDCQFKPEKVTSVLHTLWSNWTLSVSRLCPVSVSLLALVNLQSPLWLTSISLKLVQLPAKPLTGYSSPSKDESLWIHQVKKWNLQGYWPLKSSDNGEKWIMGWMINFLCSGLHSDLTMHLRPVYFCLSEGFISETTVACTVEDRVLSWDLILSALEM